MDRRVHHNNGGIQSNEHAWSLVGIDWEEVWAMQVVLEGGGGQWRVCCSLIRLSFHVRSYCWCIVVRGAR